MCIKVPVAVCTRVSGTLPVAVTKRLSKEAQGRKVSFDSSFEGSVYHVSGEGIAAGAGGNWAQLESKDRWTPMLSSAPFYSFWDTSPWEGKNHIQDESSYFS